MASIWASKYRLGRRRPQARRRRTGSQGQRTKRLPGKGTGTSGTELAIKRDRPRIADGGAN